MRLSRAAPLGALGALALACGARSELDLAGARSGPAGEAAPDGGSSATDAGNARDAAVSPGEAGGDASPETDAAAADPDCTGSGVTVTTTYEFPDAIALDGAFVYWHDQVGIARAPKQGGAAERLTGTPAQQWPDLASFALSATDAYFVSGDANGIEWMPKAGGGPTPLSSLPTFVFPGVVVGASRAFVWGEVSGGTEVIDAFALPNGAPVRVQNDVIPTAMVVTDTLAYAATSNGIVALDAQHGTAAGLGGSAAEGIAIDSTDAYFSSVDSSSGFAVARVPLSGKGTVTVVATPGAGTVVGLAVSDTDIYYGDRVTPALRKILHKTPSNVAALVTFATGDQPIGVALDARCVFVTVARSTTGGYILAAPR